jgi:hypothetical protein
VVPAVLGAVIFVPSLAAYAADGHPLGPSEIIFLCPVITLLVCGRLMDELMQRIGQPA